MSYANKEIIDWEGLCGDCKALADILKKQPKLPGKMLAVTRGGLIPAGLVARHLSIKAVDTIGLESYHGQQQSDQILNIKAASEDFLNDTLIIDDLVDTGKTFEYLKAQTRGCVFAVLYTKPAGKPFTDFSVRDFKQDTWIEFPWETESGE